MISRAANACVHFQLEFAIVHEHHNHKQSFNLIDMCILYKATTSVYNKKQL